MKKVLFSIVFIASTAFIANAQETKTTVVKEDKTTKKTSSLPQKVHNTFSKDKHYNGKKTKHTKVVEKTTTDNTAK
jgi:hypothetical protein